MRRQPLMALALSIAVASAAGCGVLGPDEEQRSELERAEDRWAAARPQAYRYAVRRLCFCGPDAIGPVRVSVVGSVATDRFYVGSGEPVPGDLASLFPSVDGLFDILRDAIGRDAHRIDVTYDPETGVPTDLRIDYRENVADEELGFTVVEPVEATGA